MSGDAQLDLPATGERADVHRSDGCYRFGVFGGVQDGQPCSANRFGLVPGSELPKCRVSDRSPQCW